MRKEKKNTRIRIILSERFLFQEINFTTSLVH